MLDVCAKSNAKSTRFKNCTGPRGLRILKTRTNTIRSLMPDNTMRAPLHGRLNHHRRMRPFTALHCARLLLPAHCRACRHMRPPMATWHSALVGRSHSPRSVLTCYDAHRTTCSSVLNSMSACPRVEPSIFLPRSSTRSGTSTRLGSHIVISRMKTWLLIGTSRCVCIGLASDLYQPVLIQVKFIDFGSAVIRDVRKPPPKYTSFFGTLTFASPGEKLS